MLMLMLMLILILMLRGTCGWLVCVEDRAVS